MECVEESAPVDGFEAIGEAFCDDRPFMKVHKVTSSSTPFIMHRNPNKNKQCWLMFAQSFLTMNQEK